METDVLALELLPVREEQVGSWPVCTSITCDLTVSGWTQMQGEADGTQR